MLPWGLAICKSGFIELTEMRSRRHYAITVVVQWLSPPRLTQGQGREIRGGAFTPQRWYCTAVVVPSGGSSGGSSPPATAAP
mgnify:CR=1 FL=1